MKCIEKERQFDIAIIGGGVVGGMIACRLGKYQLRTVILEREQDVAMGQSKANSGIVHAGYDPKPGTWKALLNVKGSEMMEQVCRDLDVKYRRNGTLVVGYDDEDMTNLADLLERGRKNGVKGLELLDGGQVRDLEKNLSKNIKGALHAPTGAVVCPYELTLHAIGHAMDHGVELMTGFDVTDVCGGGPAAQGAAGTGGAGDAEGFRIAAADGRSVRAGVVINCAGVYSDVVARMVGDESFTITPRRGEYFLLDKEAGDLVNMTIFRVPTNMGKGVLATRTVDGNILLGPTSVDQEDKEDKSATAEGLETVRRKEAEFFENIPWNQVITQFAGLRAHGDQHDFIISCPVKGFINVAGIESPGLSSAPAIGRLVERLVLGENGCFEKQADLSGSHDGADWTLAAARKVAGWSEKGLKPAALKADWRPEGKRAVRFQELSLEAKNQLIAEDPAYGRMVCRCESVTEGEIVEAIHRNPPARDVDGVKRRTRSGMGRCQGGFCMAAVAEILAREWDQPLDQVMKKGSGSYIVAGRMKGGAETAAKNMPEGGCKE